MAPFALFTFKILSEFPFLVFWVTALGSPGMRMRNW